MATIDSGTETLFSDDDASCELVGSPSVCYGDEGHFEEVNRLAPPNIQPFSGVLEKGKVVIRPIAFKPAAMTPAARFGLAGERYGSTPILTRPGSRLTLYGSSNDLRQPTASSNYSLDRKLRSSCPSASSSPPLAMSSLTSLPHKLVNYDSLESVRKSPVSTADGSMMNKASYRLSGAGGGSLLDLTPSPSDSGVSELEAALRDRDSELAYLRQTMEHNEQVIFRVYQEKEKVWERELRRMKTLHENRLRASAQKALKLEQMLMMQTYQLQQDKKRLSAETQRANCQTERLKQEVNALRGRLEETEWGLCQKTGEISLLKSQLKDYQNEQTSKCQELLQLRTEHRDFRDQLDLREAQISQLQLQCEEKDAEIKKLKEELAKELSEELSDMSLGSVESLKQEIATKTKDFEKERVVWAQEKEKVLRYQRQLQMNYVQMYRRTRALEAEVESLTIELELDKTGKKQLPPGDLTQTIEL
ncbi:leucine zipper putative tumor suppressor 2 homolog isoform X2 [Tribolium madens]|uniref:leucine zipper putative tumor suppressor 2 homolog isoform X2 n=1 Tax=Tribolium madens TaxID=41895 RepID=UPI001CF749F8|nr:leucine zipper putative tumor suppressor 2 homolog isoform X2 [Tribolium madens]